MLEPLRIHIEENLPMLPEAKLIVACSGGLDSVVLTNLLQQLGCTIALAHCNFSLRGAESDGDAEFVKTLAETLEVPYYAKQFNTEAYAMAQKESIQMAARSLRYAWFDELLNDIQFDFILTAHHADDALETFLINLSRGTGLRGLIGIPVQNKLVVRPLLPFSRAEILTYAKKEGLYWREDSSNSKDDYVRNRLRHHVIPPFKEATTNTLANFQKTQSHLADSEALIEDYMVLVQSLVMTKKEEVLEIDIQKLQELPNTDALLYELLQPYGFSAWNDINDLLRGQSGKQVYSATHRLVKDRAVLLLTLRATDLIANSFFISEEKKTIKMPISLRFRTVKRFEITNAHTVFVAAEALQYPLELRKCREGDVFQPFGMEGKKKLSKFFKDEKLSLIAKENSWVLCSEDQIVWVVGLRLDNRYKVKKTTKKIIRIDYTPS